MITRGVSIIIMNMRSFVGMVNISHAADWLLHASSSLIS